jgi:hypothetical protein
MWLQALREHGDVIEADLRHHYPGVDLTDLWRGRLTLRQVRVFVEGLPVDSRTVYALGGMDELTGWRLADLLVGRMVDELAAFRWQWETAHRERGAARRAPGSILPDLGSHRPAVGAARRQETARVVPLVSAHSLGGFVYGTDEEG